jgi:hypothetical protein
MTTDSKVFLKYIPHGINQRNFFKPETPEQFNELAELRTNLFGKADVDFVVLYNNRNIRRKMTGDVILAFWEFHKTLTPAQAAKTRLLLHTQKVDENGTDLPRLIQDVCPEINVVFSDNRVDVKILNYIYAVSDVCINLASAEGFGLSTAEALMAEKIIIANVTGGLQDQMGFVNDAGKYLHEDIDYKKEWGSNHNGRFKTCGEWAFPCFPVQRALIGSPPTPYIFDDRCSWEEAAVHIRTIYDMPKEERERRGKLGREYMITQGFSVDEMNKRFLDGFKDVFEKWTPREKYTLIKA